jgi:hypothetical protein
MLRFGATVVVGVEGWLVLVGGAVVVPRAVSGFFRRGRCECDEDRPLPWLRACCRYVLSRAKASTDALSVAMVAAPLGITFPVGITIECQHTLAVRGFQGENFVL